MSSLSDGLLDHQEIHPSLREQIERYGNQGGLLGIVVYFFAYLESEDGRLAATAAEIPAMLFVSSSLHDDAIDETSLESADRPAGSSGDQSTRRFLNQRVTVGDLAFAELLECIDALPEEFETSRVSTSIRNIGAGQLNEDEFDPRHSSKADAIRRIDQRGSVWGELAANVVGATGYYSAEQLERVTTISRNLLFVYTIFDDVEDLPEDVENGVANAPLVLLDEDAVDDADSSEAVVDAVLESDVPEQLEELVDAREAETETAAREFHDSGAYSNEAILEATCLALEWYCESVCSVPVEDSVSERSQRTIREQLSGDEEAKREYVDSVIRESPLHGVPNREFGREAATLPGRLLAPAIIYLMHVQTLTASTMPLHLEDALSRLRESRTA